LPASRALLAAVANARPKVADYPFTTLHPHLGMVRLDNAKASCWPILPGLIEGAAEARPGTQFCGTFRAPGCCARDRRRTYDDTIDPVDQGEPSSQNMKRSLAVCSVDRAGSF